MVKPTLGQGITIDVSRLIETRMLIQSNSGGGKSRTIRRILEQTYGHVQQIVIDIEGEFSTLREKFDYIYCAPHDGDAVARPQTASLLARRLMELKVSAIIDIYDLKADERLRFIRLFIDSMMNAPRKLWHPIELVIDEAHIACPEKGKAESAKSVIDAIARGRKRGISVIAATQRLAKLHKDAAAELLNVMIGRTGLDVDVKRAADILGMTAKEAMATLRHLKPGEFYVFGPALSMTVEKVLVGPVQTTHPEAGKRIATVQPAPSGKIKKVLAELADLQEESEKEAKSLADLKKDNANLRRDLTLAKKQGGGISDKEVERKVQGAVIGLERLHQKEILSIIKKGDMGLSLFKEISQKIERHIGVVGNSPKQAQTIPQKYSKPLKQEVRSQPVKHTVQIESDIPLRPGAIRILQELASRYPAGYTRSQVGLLTGYRPKGGTFSSYLSNLFRAGYLDKRGELLHATESGIDRIGDNVPPAPTTHEEVMALWKKALRPGAYKILETVIEAGQHGIEKQEIANQLGYEAGGGTFSSYVSNLYRNSLITKNGNIFMAADILFPGIG